jgi:hypothetical protein
MTRKCFLNLIESCLILSADRFVSKEKFKIQIISLLFFVQKIQLDFHIRNDTQKFFRFNCHFHISFYLLQFCSIQKR